MIRLTKQQVMLLHKDIIAESGGSAEIRDEGLLDSALNGIEVEYEDNDFIQLVLGVAAGEISDEQLLTWLQAHIC